MKLLAGVLFAVCAWSQASLSVTGPASAAVGQTVDPAEGPEVRQQAVTQEEAGLGAARVPATTIFGNHSNSNTLCGRAAAMTRPLH